MGVIDADAHVDENEHTWEFLDETERRFKPISFDLTATEPAGPSDGRRHNLWLIGGNARLRRFRSDQASGTIRESRELLDVSARLRHMDELGIDVQVLYPTTFLHTVTDRPDIELALCRAYNRWIEDRTAASGGRLRWAALAPVLSIGAAVEELAFAKDHGACGVLKKGVECGNRAASDPYFFPLYEEAERLDLPICFHQGVGDPNISNTLDGARLAEMNVITAFGSLADAHVPDQFPNLRFGFVEAGASWLPYMLKSLGMRGKAAKAGFNFKTDFLAHNRFYVTCDTEDDVAYLLNFGAEDYLMLGTDYTHVDQSAELRAHQVLADQAAAGRFNPRVAEKIATDNPRRFYGL